MALLKALIKHGLKISPKKCVPFRTSLTYMGHTLMVKDKVPYITPLKSRVDAVTKMNLPTILWNGKLFINVPRKFTNDIGPYL